MYVESLHIYDVRCFTKAVVPAAWYPGRKAGPDQAVPPHLRNANLLLGGNGLGKSTVLKSLALAALSPVILESGFRPYRLVRRPGADKALIKAKVRLGPADAEGARPADKPIDLLCRLAPLRGDSDRFVERQVPESPLLRDMYDDESPSFFVAGYGATRRVEVGEYDPGSLRKSRSTRYQRVATLFEDHLALTPVATAFARMTAAQRAESTAILNRLLPDRTRFTGKRVRDEWMFKVRGRPVPFAALSDGYRAFVGWVVDLLGHMSQCAPPKARLRDLAGLVMIDEVDLHLHPEWQRVAVPAIARAFPKLQFFFTTHSPIVAGTLTRHNVFVMEPRPGGQSAIVQREDRIHGLDAEQVLLSPYFGLATTRAPDAEDRLGRLSAQAADGDLKAAVAYTRQLAGLAAGDDVVTTGG